MSKIELALPHHAYSIHIEPGSLTRLGELVRNVAPHEQAAILVDAGVKDAIAPEAERSVRSAGYQICTCTIPSGEPQKTLDTVRYLYDELLNRRFERRSPIIALGGGVVGDLAGFVAATYLRGVPFVQCPTTLLAMVDASVGGKVGVNLPQGKNLVGAFYQPRRVVIDTNVLSTLPTRELRCGLAECVKHAMVRDPDLFEWIDRNIKQLLALDPDRLVELVDRNVRIKAAVVMADEKESGIRAHLNFGHTFAHAIEDRSPSVDRDAAAGAGRYRHGEAVALGMIAATHLACRLNRCDARVLARLVELLRSIGLPTSAQDLPPPEKLIQIMRFDKKVVDGRLRLVLPRRIGQVSIDDDVQDDLIAGTWEALQMAA